MAHSIAKLAKEKGNVAFEARDYGTARSLYSHTMAYDRGNHLYPLNRSMANLKLGRWDEAEADATKALNLCPRNLKALFRRGRARKELGKYYLARVDIRRFIDNGGDVTLGTQELNAIAAAESSPPSEGTSYISSGPDSANLHLQDDSSVFVIHTSKTVRNGEGAFASRDIRGGDLILSERPIFCIPIDVPEPFECIFIEAAVRNLSPAQLDRYLSLQNSHTECLCFPDHPLIGIFSTNSYAVPGGNEAGIYSRASKFNHSCSPNAIFSSDPNTGELRIHALGTIPRGEEIFVAYIGNRCLHSKPRRLRQMELLAAYHFTCDCPLCSLPEAESKMSDARLWEIVSLQKVAHEMRRFVHCI